MIKFLVLGLSGFLVVLAACAPGLPTRGDTRSYTLRVLDAERNEPIPNARLDLHLYPFSPQMPDEERPYAQTNAAGELTIAGQAAMTIWQVQAPGMIGQQLSTDQGVLPTRYAAHADQSYDGKIYLYQLPQPTVTLVVSDSYSGPVTVDLQPAPGFDFVPTDEINVAFAAVDPQASYIQGQVGRRAFTETVSAEGLAALTVTPLLFDLDTAGIQVRDGAGILPRADLADPALDRRSLWGTVNDQDKLVQRAIRLFVGTREEYLQFSQSDQ